MPRVLVLVFCVALFTACVPPEESNDRIVRYDEDTLMGQIQARGFLKVGVPPDFEPFSFARGDGAPRGFVIDLSREIGDALGVETRFVPTPSEFLLDVVDYGGADLAFPPLALTEELARTHTFASPYWVAHQRVLSTAVAAERICASLQQDVGVEVAGEALRVAPPPAGLNRCLAALRARRVDAITASDAFLLGLVDDVVRATMTGDQLTTEGFAPAVALGASAFADLVTAVIVESKDEGRWMKLYEDWIAPRLPPEERLIEPQRMTMGEAAALYPIE